MLSECLDSEVGVALVAYRKKLEAVSDSSGGSERTEESDYDLLNQESRVES